MKSTLQTMLSKADYEVPKIDISPFPYVDIITTSGLGDEDQGEWDPQLIDNP